MDKELVNYFVQECREEMEWKERCRQNFIEFDNYFKFSGTLYRNVERKWNGRKDVGKIL